MPCIEIKLLDPGHIYIHIYGYPYWVVVTIMLNAENPQSLHPEP